MRVFLLLIKIRQELSGNLQNDRFHKLIKLAINGYFSATVGEVEIPPNGWGNKH